MLLYKCFGLPIEGEEDEEPELNYSEAAAIVKTTFVVDFGAGDDVISLGQRLARLGSQIIDNPCIAHRLSRSIV